MKGVALLNRLCRYVFFWPLMTSPFGAQITLELPDLPGMGAGWELLLPSDEVSRRCTASVAVTCHERRAAILKACVTLGTRRVSEAFGVSREVVRALRSEAIRSGELDRFKQEEGLRCFALADRILDRLEDEVDRLPIASAALTAGILLDKAQLLTGAPTARILHEVSMGVADVAAYIDALPSVQPVREGEKVLQKEASDLPALSTDLPSSAINGDLQSLVSAHPTQAQSAIRAELGRIDTLSEGAT